MTKLGLTIGMLLAATAFGTGCAPGLSHQGRWAEPVGTTELTNAEVGTRAKLDSSDPWGAKPAPLDTSDPWTEAPAAPPPAHTWGNDAPAAEPTALK